MEYVIFYRLCSRHPHENRQKYMHATILEISTCNDMISPQFVIIIVSAGCILRRSSWGSEEALEPKIPTRRYLKSKGWTRRRKLLSTWVKESLMCTVFRRRRASVVVSLASTVSSGDESHVHMATVELLKQSSVTTCRRRQWEPVSKW